MNIYEIAKRQTKAFALAQALHRARITEAEARRMNFDDWAKAAFAAKVKMPSAETIAVTLEALAGMEKYDLEFRIPPILDAAIKDEVQA